MQISTILTEVYNLPHVSIALALTIILAAVIHYSIQNKGVPPGPIGLPYIGYWPFLNEKTCPLQLDEMKKKYGDIFSFSCCGRLFINLGTVKAVREAYMTKSDYFAERYDNYALLNYVFDGGIVTINGDSWTVLKKFFLQVFKERGMLAVKDSMSGTLYDTMKATIDDLKSENGKPINITKILSSKCNTIFRQTLFGETCVTDEDILEINKFYGNILRVFSPKHLLLMGNVARFLIYPFKSRVQAAMKNHAVARKLIYKLIDDHKSTYEEDNIRDIIDEYLKEKHERQSRGDPTAKLFTDKALMASLVQFVGDGALTVATFVTLFLKNATERPEEQEKMYQELIDVVGEDREPTIEDKSKLTYTNAFMMEVQRMSEFVPFFPSLECTEETTLNGYRIPKGSIAITNIYSSHFDPGTYEEPEKFNPSRFIAKEGKRRSEFPITFGVGKRSCLGEGFVMIQTFLFLATIIKNFRLSIAEGNADHILDILYDRHFLVYAEPRRKEML